MALDQYPGHVFTEQVAPETDGYQLAVGVGNLANMGIAYQ